jgi:hypothetical protein
VSRPATALAQAVAASALLALAAGCADGAGQTSAPPPDLSGFWSPMMRDVAPPQALLDRIPPGAAILEDVGPVELPSGDFGGLLVRPEARAAALRWQPDDDMALDRACSPPSIIYAMQGPFPMEIHQATELTVIRLEYFDMARLIFTDGRDGPPEGAPHSKTGSSIGRWDGDTLIVDTTRLSPSTITNNGLDHSEHVRFTEHFLLDGDTLYSTQVFEDPQVLENVGARIMAWTRRPGQFVYPYECDPTFALEFMNR